MKPHSRRRVRKPQPSTIRRRLMYHRLREDLIAQLGGVCVICGKASQLTFDPF